MFIKSIIDDSFGVSIIKKDSKKVAINLAKLDTTGKVNLISSDEEFKFNNPLITDKSITVFEFIVEMNNFVKRQINKV